MRWCPVRRPPLRLLWAACRLSFPWPAASLSSRPAWQHRRIHRLPHTLQRGQACDAIHVFTGVQVVAWHPCMMQYMHPLLHPGRYNRALGRQGNGVPESYAPRTILRTGLFARSSAASNNVGCLLFSASIIRRIVNNTSDRQNKHVTHHFEHHFVRMLQCRLRHGCMPLPRSSYYQKYNQ